MKGSFHIIVQNRYLKYEFDIRRNLTIIQGNSATGKTTLVDMIREFHMSEKSGVNFRVKDPAEFLKEISGGSRFLIFQNQSFLSMKVLHLLRQRNLPRLLAIAAITLLL